jgi:ribonuclease HII
MEVQAVSREPDLSVERRLWAHGYTRVAGLDEAGRGAWAGPVVAAAVILPPDRSDVLACLAPVRDSKLLSPAQRERCYDLIVAHALAYGVAAVSPAEIDRIGIVPATRRAMALAAARCRPTPDYLLIDALALPEVDTPQYVTTKGDRRHLSIAAASIVAKVTRDRMMVGLDARLAGYGLAQHKGYGTARHRQALCERGVSLEHRRSYAPVRALLEGLDG